MSLITTIFESRPISPRGFRVRTPTNTNISRINLVLDAGDSLVLDVFGTAVVGGAIYSRAIEAVNIVSVSGGLFGISPMLAQNTNKKSNFMIAGYHSSAGPQTTQPQRK